MRILFVRHGDPDYENDTLTEKGKVEARLLSEIADQLHVGTCYVSPLGRAKDTAAYTLQKLGLTAETKDWLQEFPSVVDINGSEEFQKVYPDTNQKDGKFEPRIAWDMLPSYWTEQPELMDRELWKKSKVAECNEIGLVYDSIIENFDRLLAKYGYVREGMHYHVEKESQETITFFCHFGVACAILSHLWNISPFLLWHGLALAPSSVTEVVSEERERGIAYFRGLRIGDSSHLSIGKEKPSFACRFCEVYSNEEQRH